MIKRNVIVILFLFFSFGIFSQSKIAHINTYELINSMPEKLEAEKILEKYYKERDAEISAMEAELSFKAEQYARESMSKTKQERDEMVEEIQGMQDNISLYMEEINKQMVKKQEELIKPIYEKVLEVIKQVGKENGYNYVLDSSQNQGILLADGDDIMALVKIKLGF